MSATSIQSSISVSRMPVHSVMNHSRMSDRPRVNDRSAFTHHTSSPSPSRTELAPFVDLENSPYPPQPAAASVPTTTEETDQNPVAELIPDELYELLRSNDLINEKGVRDYIIRRAFKAMREQQELKSCEALERLQAIYPYLQIDTIRKIIYRIGPAAGRKVLL